MDRTAKRKQAGIIDEAGPYATRPQAGGSWQLQGKAKLQPHEYLRDGGAKLMTLFRPATGEVRAKGVISVTNAILHPWLQEQLLSILESEKEARNQDGHQPAPNDWVAGACAAED